ncbi:MAG: hypothetical protein P4L91_10010 [Burkholderiaceae bacterium]|nr:hypothetical protein [Burkholderiaceae bacterium]
MEKSDMGAILTIDEQALFQLLESAGKVHVRIDQLGKYFVPYIFFADADTDEIKPRGVIVRNNCMLGAESAEGAYSVLQDIADDIGAVQIGSIARSDSHSNFLEVQH